MPVSGDPLTAASPVSISLYEVTAANHLAISSSMGVLPDGVTYTTYTVMVEDAAGQVITTGSGSGVNSTLSVSANSGNLDMGMSPTSLAAKSSLTGITITNGTGTFTVDNTAYQSNPATLTVVDSNSSIASATATYTCMVGAPGYAIAMPSGAAVRFINVLPGQHEVIQGQLTDVNGNPVAEAGQPIWFTLVDASGVLALPNNASTNGDSYEAFTNASGVATIAATVLQTAPLYTYAGVVVSGSLGAYSSGSEGPDYYALTPSNYTTTLSTTLPGGTVTGGTVLPAASIVGLNALGAPVGNTAFDIIDVASSNPSVLAVADAQIQLSVRGSATVSNIIAKMAGTATLTFTDVSEPNAPPIHVTYTVVPGSAQATQAIEYNGAPVGTGNPVSLTANTPVELQVVNVDAGGNPIDVTGTTPLAVGLPSAPAGMQWEVSDGAVGHSELVVEIPAGQSSANVWLVSSTTSSNTSLSSSDTSAYQATGIAALSGSESSDGGAGVTVSWTVPVDGSSTLVGYQIWAIPAGGTPFEVPTADLSNTNGSGLVSATSSSTVVKGLTEDTGYAFNVDAVYSTASGTAVKGVPSATITTP